MLTVFGLAVFAFLFGGMLRAKAYRWRYLAESYAADPGPPVGERNMRSAVLVGLGAFNSLKGIMTIRTHETGVSFRVMPAFSLFHEPLFVPYTDIRGWKTTWYLDAPSSELEFRRAPQVKMILPAEDAEWIREHAGQKMAFRNVPPPQGNAGRASHFFATTHALLSLVMLAGLAFFFFFGPAR
ncbi:MAG: hypothetical protein GC150_09645 [Rhizobiales bacterium]|nr:hypothetical protein [Hyphomicrobiales bacterium]